MAVFRHTAEQIDDLLDQVEVLINRPYTTGLDYEMGMYTPAEDVSRPEIPFTKEHSEPPIYVGIVDATGTLDAAANSIMIVSIFNESRLTGTGYQYNATDYRYGIAQYSYRGSTTNTTSYTAFTYPDTNAGKSANSYARYWISETGFRPYAGSAARYFRSGRTYQWIAVWRTQS